MRNIEIENNTIMIDGISSKVECTKKSIEDLNEYHNIDAISEIIKIMISELDYNFSLTNEEKSIYEEKLRIILT